MVKDPNLLSLSSDLKSTILSAKAQSTQLSYIRSYDRWKLFCSTYPEICPLPADPIYVALYLQHIINTTHSVSSVNSAFYAIRWAHATAGLSSPTDHSIVTMVKEAASRILGCLKKNRKEPISVDILRSIISQSNLEDLVELRNATMLILCFSGFLRANEVLSIRRHHINFLPDHMSIFIPKAKNDQLREGHTVLISKMEGSYCPVTLMRKYLSLACIEDCSEMLIFRGISRSKSKCNLVSKDASISYSTFRSSFKSLLSSVGEDPALFGTHSLRSGGATVASNENVNDRLFQRHGRWRSVGAKNIYVKDSTEKKLSVSKALDLF